MAEILHRLHYVREGHLVSVTRDDLVGQYIGHTAPKTKDVIKKAMGGVLFIDEAYYLYRPENERDYGQEAIEISAPGDGEQPRGPGGHSCRLPESDEHLFPEQPGCAVACRTSSGFSGLLPEELLAIAKLMLARRNYRFSEDGVAAFEQYIDCACACRISPTPARYATPWTVPGCARPTACSSTADSAS